MPAPLPAPLLAEDATEEWWETRTEEYRAVVTAWLASEGIDIADLIRVEVFLLDAPFARLCFQVRDDDDRAVINEAGDGIVTRTETVLLSSLPPALE